jgi:CDK inhibitor PHO81
MMIAKRRESKELLHSLPAEEEDQRLGLTPSINDFADALLTVVFEHTRQTRKKADG